MATLIFLIVGLGITIAIAKSAMNSGNTWTAIGVGIWGTFGTLWVAFHSS